MEDMSASVLREPKEILTPAVESSTSVSPAPADSMLDATVKEELTDASAHRDSKATHDNSVLTWMSAS
jgi:hypothetical protein